MYEDESVLDWSNFTGVPTSGEIAMAKAAGWKRVILGTQNISITRQQYDACYANDFPVEALYVFVYWDVADTGRIIEARDLALEWGLKVYVDCEWTMMGYPGTGWAPPASDLVLKIWRYKGWLGAQYGGIYTGAWWWTVYVNDSQEFKDDPLWAAIYGAVPTPEQFAVWKNFGGWLRPTIIQYSSGGTGTMNADLNVEERWIVDEPDMVWLYGGKLAGLELRYNTQQFVWNNFVDVDAIGSPNGEFPGAHYHRQGAVWVQVLP